MADADFITIIYFYLFLLQLHVLKLESLILMSSENLYINMMHREQLAITR